MLERNEQGMNQADLLSIVIITCNRKDELKKTIESCIAKVDMPIEIIIVDNGSTDGTRDMLNEMSDTIKCTIRPYFSKHNLGVSGGRNRGFELAKSDIVLFMDDDAIFDDESALVDTAYRYMKADDKIGALAFDIFDTKEQGRLMDSFKNGNPQQKLMLSYIGACHMLRKTYDRKYLYPPKLMYGAEERYASILYYNMGMRVEYFPDIKVIHNPSTKTRMSKISTHRNVAINQYVIKKLLLPPKFQTRSTVYFIIRELKKERFNIVQVKKNLQVAKVRLNENIEASRPIENKTIEKLCSDYGKYVIF